MSFFIFLISFRRAAQTDRTESVHIILNPIALSNNFLGLANYGIQGNERLLGLFEVVSKMVDCYFLVFADHSFVQGRNGKMTFFIDLKKVEVIFAV